MNTNTQNDSDSSQLLDILGSPSDFSGSVPDIDSDDDIQSRTPLFKMIFDGPSNNLVEIAKEDHDSILHEDGLADRLLQVNVFFNCLISF